MWRCCLTHFDCVENGVRVASETSTDPTAVVGIAVSEGSLAEAGDTMGLSSMLRRMILTSTAKRDGQNVASNLEELGASVIRSEGVTVVPLF